MINLTVPSKLLVDPPTVRPQTSVRESSEETDCDDGDESENRNEAWSDNWRCILRQPRKLHLKWNKHHESKDPDRKKIPDEFPEHPFVPVRLTTPLLS